MNRKRLLMIVVALAIGASTIPGLVRFFQHRRSAGESTALMLEARDKLHLGMTRAEVETHVDEAWRHYLCDLETFSVSVYLFGNRDPELPGTLYLRFQKENGVETLDMIAYVEPYMLHEFDHCEIKEK